MAPDCHVSIDGWWHRQLAHAIRLLGLLGAAWPLADFDNSQARLLLLGLSVKTWFAIALAIPVLHQMLFGLSDEANSVFGACTRAFGARAFAVYQAMLRLRLGGSLVMFRSSNEFRFDAEALQQQSRSKVPDLWRLVFQL